MSISRSLAAMLATTMFVVAVPTVGSAVAGPLPTSASPTDPTTVIVESIVERLLLADAVAQSKWVTRSAIDDPIREKTVLDDAVRTAPRGASPDRVRVVIGDQIEASKTFQRELFIGWRVAPGTAPRARPDLTATRRRISELTADIVARLAERDVNRDPGCLTALVSTTSRAVVDRRLAAPQIAALIQAERSVCSL